MGTAAVVGCCKVGMRVVSLLLKGCSPSDGGGDTIKTEGRGVPVVVAAAVAEYGYKVGIAVVALDGDTLVTVGMILMFRKVESSKSNVASNIDIPCCGLLLLLLLLSLLKEEEDCCFGAKEGALAIELLLLLFARSWCCSCCDELDEFVVDDDEDDDSTKNHKTAATRRTTPMTITRATTA